MKTKPLAILLFVLFTLCLYGCDSGAKGAMSFQAGYYYEEGEITALYILYDVSADKEDNYCFSKNGLPRDNVFITYGGESYYDYSSDNIWVTGSNGKLFENLGYKYVSGCSRDNVLLSGTNETLHCVSIFTLKRTPESDAEPITMTAKYLPN